MIDFLAESDRIELAGSDRIEEEALTSADAVTGLRRSATLRAAGRRTDRAAEMRELILAAAERMFAEHGVAAVSNFRSVSNRQVSEAAGQGNNTAVGYHFGTETDLVRAIVAKHCAAIAATRERMLAEYGRRWRPD